MDKGPVIERWVVLTFQVPTWRRAGTLSSLLTGPRQLHPGGPGEAWQVGAGLSVRLSVSTHHRAQSLFPRLKPSQLKSSKPRVVGATPPPVEERDRCSREGGRGGGPAKLVGGPCPTLDMHLQLHTTCHSPGPTDSRDKTRRGREGDKAGRSNLLSRIPPSWLLFPHTPANPAALRAGRGQSAGAALLSQSLPQNLPRRCRRAPAPPPSLLPETSWSHIICMIPATSLGHLYSSLLNSLLN